MKRTPKIAITRQTLRTLSDTAAKAVAGGASHKCTSDTENSHGFTCGNVTVCASNWFNC